MTLDALRFQLTGFQSIRVCLPVGGAQKMRIILQLWLGDILRLLLPLMAVSQVAVDRLIQRWK